MKKNIYLEPQTRAMVLTVKTSLMNPASLLGDPEDPNFPGGDTDEAI